MRLSLRPMTGADVSAIHRIANEPGVRKYLFDDKAVTIDFVESIFQQSSVNFESRGFGIWIVKESASAELIGFCGLRYAEELKEIEILYALTESKWRLGYASEAALAVQRYAFDDAHMERLIGITDLGNHKSWRVLERLRMREYLPPNAEERLRYAFVMRSEYLRG
jgi:[ribosomal protein S5]-alanine N-acetyltransferase